MMEEGEDRVRASYRDNYDRLAKVKAKYDPENFFRVNQNIKPAVCINLAFLLVLALRKVLLFVVKEFEGSVVGGLDPPGNSILGKAVEGVRATNPMLVGVTIRSRRL